MKQVEFTIIVKRRENDVFSFDISAKPEEFEGEFGFSAAQFLMVWAAKQYAGTSGTFEEGLAILIDNARGYHFQQTNKTQA